MEKIYEQSPYTKEFEAVVISCKAGKTGFETELDRTAFYPEGGGQPFDTGMLGAVRVLEVHERDGAVIHHTDGWLEPGTSVRGAIDWDRRFNHMQQHSGEHIVSGLIHGQYGYDNVGFHMGAQETTIDVNGVLDFGQLEEIERKANQIIYQNIALRITYPSEDELKYIDYRSKKELTGQVRIVEVPGADVCACCGTHVEKTGEIGVIKFLSMIHYKGGIRATMLCGEKALLDYEKKTNQVNRLSTLLSSSPDKAVEAVERLKLEAAEREQKNIFLYRQLFEMKAERCEPMEKSLLFFEEGLSPQLVRQFCNLLMEKGKGRIVAVCSEKQDGGFNYCIGSREGDMKALGKALNGALHGRGGGSSQMVQGTFLADGDTIRRVFEEQAAAAL